MNCPYCRPEQKLRQIEFCKQPTGCDSTVISIKALDELRAVALQLGVDNAKLRSTMEKIRELIS